MALSHAATLPCSTETIWVSLALWGNAWRGCRDHHRKIQVCRFSACLCHNAAFCEQWHIFISFNTRLGKIRDYYESEQFSVIRHE